MSTSNENDRDKLLNDFLQKFDLKFKNTKLLNQALCHTSYTNENNLDVSLSYERLEFLGDAVLKLCISKFLYNDFENYQEGVLTKLRAEAVSDKCIAVWAKRMGLSELIILGKNEKKHKGAVKESILACAFEAVLGAIFLEYKTKGLDKAYNFLIDNFKDDIFEINKNIKTLNPKAILQEYTQSKNHKLPEYITVKEEGLEHDKTFFVEVKYNNKLIGQGFAKSIKEAQQNAAREGLLNLGVKL